MKKNHPGCSCCGCCLTCLADAPYETLWGTVTDRSCVGLPASQETFSVVRNTYQGSACVATGVYDRQGNGAGAQVVFGHSTGQSQLTASTTTSGQWGYGTQGSNGVQSQVGANPASFSLSADEDSGAPFTPAPCPNVTIDFAAAGAASLQSVGCRIDASSISGWVASGACTPWTTDQQLIGTGVFNGACDGVSGPGLGIDGGNSGSVSGSTLQLNGYASEHKIRCFEVTGNIVLLLFFYDSTNHDRQWWAFSASTPGSSGLVELTADTARSHADCAPATTFGHIDAFFTG